MSRKSVIKIAKLGLMKQKRTGCNLCPGFDGVQRLPDEDLSSSSDAPSQQLVHRRGITHYRRSQNAMKARSGVVAKSIRFTRINGDKAIEPRHSHDILISSSRSSALRMKTRLARVAFAVVILVGVCDTVDGEELTICASCSWRQ
jgi:hypothetical protein